MKIGVFGDSFADQNFTSIWWKYLESIHKHEVKSFGMAGSSISFSAKEILKNHQDYEFIIWCVTSANRITVWDRNTYREIAVHVTGRHHVQHPDPEIQDKIDATERYLLRAWDGPDNEFQSHCVIEYVRNVVPNMLIIPCFTGPMFEHTCVGFNLFELCQRETNFYFGNTNLADIYTKYYDLRPGHLTNSTQLALADLIDKSLSPGIFSARYEDFPNPTDPFEKVFEKIKH